MRSLPMLVAHRGMPRAARENTLVSFGLAIEAGAGGIELDVHATRDGVVVVHHDAAIPGVGEIAGATLSDITLRSPSLPLATLEQVLQLVAGRVEVFVEIKGPRIEEQVLGVLQWYTGSVAIHSFDHDQIARIAAVSAGTRLGILFDEFPADVATAMSKCGALDVWPNFRLVTAALVEEVHALNGRVIPWTVNDRSDAECLVGLGVDALCGDDVGQLRAWTI